VLSVDGKLIKSFKNIPEDGKLRIDNRSGIYLLKIYIEGAVVTKKVIVQN